MVVMEVDTGDISLARADRDSSYTSGSFLKLKGDFRFSCLSIPDMNRWGLADLAGDYSLAIT
jgi:hypothetical protein